MGNVNSRRDERNGSLWWASSLGGLLALPAAAACGPDAHDPEAIDAAAEMPRSDAPRGPEPDATRADGDAASRDAGAAGGGSPASALHASTCSAGGVWPDCFEGGDADPTCDAGACDPDGSAASIPDASTPDASAASIPDASTPGASDLRDDGGDASCRSGYVACMENSRSPQDIERCGAAGRACGFDPASGPGLACSLGFAACITFDLTGYQRCIDEVLACQELGAPP